MRLKRGEAEQKAVEFLTRTRRRARSNRNVVFLLSQVSQGGRKGGRNGEKMKRKQERSATNKKGEKRVFQGCDTGILR